MTKGGRTRWRKSRATSCYRCNSRARCTTMHVGIDAHPLVPVDHSVRALDSIGPPNGSFSSLDGLHQSPSSCYCRTTHPITVERAWHRDLVRSRQIFLDLDRDPLAQMVCGAHQHVRYAVSTVRSVVVRRVMGPFENSSPPDPASLQPHPLPVPTMEHERPHLDRAAGDIGQSPTVTRRRRGADSSNRTR